MCHLTKQATHTKTMKFLPAAFATLFDKEKQQTQDTEIPVSKEDG